LGKYRLGTYCCWKKRIRVVGEDVRLGIRLKERALKREGGGVLGTAVNDQNIRFTSRPHFLKNIQKGKVLKLRSVFRHQVMVKKANSP